MPSTIPLSQFHLNPQYHFLCHPAVPIPLPVDFRTLSRGQHSRAETLVGWTVGGVGQAADAALRRVPLQPELAVRDAGLGAHHQRAAERTLRVAGGRHPGSVRLGVRQTHVQAVANTGTRSMASGGRLGSGIPDGAVHT